MYKIKNEDKNRTNSEAFSFIVIICTKVTGNIWGHLSHQSD